ncbi:major facilitator superfamily domain-containing protein [Umbelopsis sp. PMI_123]|nr:major facilitator superfamily domain-containing protein [Umbelopsis sp. PMI_123]
MNADVEMYQYGTKSNRYSSGRPDIRQLDIRQSPHNLYSDDAVSSPSETQTVIEDSSFKPRTYPIAWFILFLLVLLRSSVSIYQTTFSPIPSVTAEYMGVTLTAINWLANVQSVVYVILSFFTGWIFETIGVKKSLLLAGCLNTVGCWIRWIAVQLPQPSFPFLMIGQIISSTSCPLTLNIMTMFAATWFTENRRATAGVFVASNYGGIISYFLMPAIATGKERIGFTLVMVAVIATAATVPFFFIPEKPPTPASVVSTEPRPSYFGGIKLLIRNPHYWVLLMIHGLNVGLSISFGTLFTQILTPYGYTNSQAGILSAVALVSGTLGCSVAGPVLDITKQHKLFLRLMAPLMLSTYIAFIFIIQKDSFAAVLYVNAMNQFFLSFLVPVVIELSAEASYPVSESTSSSFLWQFCQIFGFIFVLVMDQLRDPDGEPKDNLTHGLIFQCCAAGVCAILCFLYNGPMKRTEALQAMSNQEVDNLAISKDGQA